jgi:hypothetical protein
MVPSGRSRPQHRSSLWSCPGAETRAPAASHPRRSRPTASRPAGRRAGQSRRHRSPGGDPRARLGLHHRPAGHPLALHREHALPSRPAVRYVARRRQGDHGHPEGEAPPTDDSGAAHARPGRCSDPSTPEGLRRQGLGGCRDTAIVHRFLDMGIRLDELANLAPAGPPEASGRPEALARRRRPKP